MVRFSNNPWETEMRAGLVSIGSHKLHISTSGPPRKADEPVIIMCTGAGAPACAYIRFQRLLSKHWRVYFPDRSGYDRSERGLDEVLTAQTGATELLALLKAIDVNPPYVLVGNSYGGIAARAFLEVLQPGDVRGMLLAETGTELLYHLYPVIPDPALAEVAKGVDIAELTNFKEECGLTDEEYDAIIQAVERTAPANKVEDHHGSAFELAQCRQYHRRGMGDWPVSVVKCEMVGDFKKLYAEGVRRGQGTDEQRAQARAFIKSLETFDDELRYSQMRLSSCSRYVEFPGRGHDDLIRNPEDYIPETRWIMDNQKQQ